MQSRKTMKYHCMSIRMAKIKSSDNTKYWGACRVAGFLMHCSGESNMVQSLWKIVWLFLKELNTHLAHHLVLIQYLRSWAVMFAQNFHPHKSPYIIFGNCFICNSWKLQITKTFSNRWLVTETMIHLYCGISLSNKEEQSSDTCNNLDGSQWHYAER